MSRQRSNRRHALPYRVLSVVIVGGLLALLLAAFSGPSQQVLSSRTLLLLLAGMLLVFAVILELVFRDLARLRERVRLLEKERES